MKVQMRQDYESPRVAIIEIVPQGVLCVSDPGRGGITVEDVTSEVIAFP